MRKIKPKKELTKKPQNKLTEIKEKTISKSPNLFEKMVWEKLKVYLEELGNIPEKLKTKKLLKRKNEIINEASVINNDNLIQELFFDINSRFLSFVQDIDDFFDFEPEDKSLLEFFKEKAKLHLIDIRKKDFFKHSNYTPIELKKRYIKTLTAGNQIKKSIIHINDYKNTTLIISRVSKIIKETSNKMSEDDMFPTYRFFLNDDLCDLCLYFEAELEAINQLLPDSTFNKNIKILFQKWYKEMLSLKNYIKKYVIDRNENSKEALGLQYTKIMDQYKVKTEQSILPIKDEHRQDFILSFIDRHTTPEIKKRIKHLKTELTKIEKKEKLISTYIETAKEILKDINTQEDFDAYEIYLKTLNEKQIIKELEELKEIY